MKFGSVCSGIEAASVAWEPMGWNASWFAEIEPFPSAVLNHHWPHVSNLGDMTMIAEMVANDEVEAPDVLVGGTPCQAFSVAGARKSLDDHRGQLSLEYIKLANSIDDKRIENQKQPSIIVWENVPGVLNTKDNAFGCFLGAIAGESSELQPTGGRWSNAGIVFGPQRAIAWRILDAQYFGVAQRRRHVFVVASARKGFNPAKVLFEWEGLRRDIAPSRSEGEEVAGSTKSNPYLASGKPCIGTLMANAGTKLWLGNQDAFSGDDAIIHSRRDYKDATDLVVAANDNSVGIISHFWNGDNLAATITKNSDNQRMPDNSNAQLLVTHQYVNDTVTAKYQKGADIPPMGRSAGNVVIMNSIVRRLTPIECERLQGFPDNHTQIPYRNKSADLCPDGPRYAACGNSMAVPVMAWIGQRINQACGNAL